MKVLLATMALALSIAPSARSQTMKDGFVKTTDGTRIHYVEAGRGRSIVFIPGWALPGSIWQKQIDELSKKYRVIAVDPRSQGKSDKPTYGHLPENRARDYKEVIDQLGLKQPVLVGWSMGAGEALGYIEQFGEDGVGGLVLVDGPIWNAEDPQVMAGLSQVVHSLQVDKQKGTEAFVRSMYQRPQSEEYIKETVQDAMLTPTDTAVALMYNMVAVQDYSKALARINRPVLFTYEPYLQPNAEFLKQSLGDRVRLERFDGDGHALFVDDPIKFNRVVDEFVQSLPKQ